ncbi:hypothetical protein BDF21DRAFT_406856 [Thamnidium elegans]|uniref:Uncharacterized protein n=1 Tax=Thamnidium elegans TaxID=101142 RepID=A0A8H7VUA6_9FUNG|nr:hypothetical protein INT48_000378 [Thamnidium elegans]KAI8095846.1 hypothetical protein BDF21DRAFT_406856 [Thamnidium elegans]
MLKLVSRSLLIPRLNAQQQNISLLCKRVALLNLTPRLFYNTAVKPNVKNPKLEIPENNEKFHANLSPSELLRKEALKIEVASSLRPRCLWLEEEDKKLLRLVEEHGKRWTFISKFFIDRPASTLMNRYSLLTDEKGRGPWSEEELKVLRESAKGKSPDEVDNWEEIRKALPNRPMFLIKQKYIYSLNPATKFGRWTQEESAKLEQLISRYGENNLDKVAIMMGSRTRRQCLERWRWQMTSNKKGRFSPDEDEKILEAVSKYGENFAVVAKVIGSDRTARHISQHYRNILAPNIDRSPWTPEEQHQVYEVCTKYNGNMIETKKELGSRRAIRDMWNHYVTERKLQNKDTKTK